MTGNYLVYIPTIVIPVHDASFEYRIESVDANSPYRV